MLRYKIGSVYKQCVIILLCDKMSPAKQSIKGMKHKYMFIKDGRTPTCVGQSTLSTVYFIHRSFLCVCVCVRRVFRALRSKQFRWES